MAGIGRSFTGLLAGVLCFGPALAGAGGASERAGMKSRRPAPNDLYVVRMLEAPAVAYRGGLPGLQATRPAPGTRIDPADPRVAAYVRFLDSRHDAALARVGGRKVYDYRYSFNGFAAALTPAAAQALRSVPGVLSVDRDELREADTSSTPSFLGLDAPGGLWDQLGGTANAGEGIIIGIIDSGIWAGHPSFSDRVGGKNGDKLGYLRIPTWHGRCVPGEAFTANDCNQKLIGAQYFNAGFGGNAGIEAERPWEFTSARDYNGHGTHTASTAGGNLGVPATGPASVFGAINGIAPRARIAAYKALWSTEDASTASGTDVDLVAAIDQAVADGVDVINYSISGTLTNFRDPVEIAFLFAADAGIFVSASAGNSGPATSTVAHPGPWLTTVAAGTHNRDGRGAVTLGNGVTYTGASVATAIGPLPLIDAAAAGLPGADPAKVALCYAAADSEGVPVLDPALVAGKIVVCDRGVTARVNKSLAVAEAGGAGMILVNTSVNSINADFHFVPTVHLQSTDRAAVKAYAATSGATATIQQATIVYDAPAPFTASFSSRGPLRAGGGDLLKPDLIAPGQDILAAVAPPGNHGLSFNLYSGTSMSAPHVAGLAALLKQRHPGWSPAMIKSALMTTAGDVLDGPSTHPLVIFRQGAGHAAPNAATSPGLVFDAGFADWLGFLCGTQLPTSFCTGSGVPVLDPSDLNGASIAIGDLAGVQTVTRTVTNVGPAASYTVSAAGLAGFDVAVSPASFTLGAGQKQTVQVTFTRTDAPLNAYVGGQLTWDDGNATTSPVRVPVVVRPVALAAPAEVSSDGAAIEYGVRFGYTGAFTATPRGLVPAIMTEGSVSDDPTDDFVPGGPGTTSFDVTIPAGTTYARFALFDEHTTPASDLDLYVYLGETQVGSSGGGTSAEQVNLASPAAGTYKVWVHGFDAASPSTFTLFTWILGSADAGNMTVTAPAAATLGQNGTIGLSFTGLSAGTKYLGSVAYGGVTGMPNPTIVRVDP